MALLAVQLRATDIVWTDEPVSRPYRLVRDGITIVSFNQQDFDDLVLTATRLQDLHQTRHMRIRSE